MKKSAIISECGKYRYRLSRIWNDNLAKVLFIMLNPSTADADEDDPTIRRCIAFAKSWGYGGIYVGNVFAYRATDPAELKKVKNPTGINNHGHLSWMASEANGPIILAWGNGYKLTPNSPSFDVLNKLAESTKVLLQKYDYDGHGWEEVSHAVDRAEEIVKEITALYTK